ncbi:MAG TPA: TetR/AcrR family transcriptional regulator [Bacteroidetes bacterium]|nr:TetR/AcrR family transcriptional regulator [Bacteroidota bacterium]
MVKTPENTEEKIIRAARKVFIQKGMDGARMQGIADEAGINKSLLHYYFRSKDKLFSRVFSEAFNDIIEMSDSVFAVAEDIDSLLDEFVKRYIGLLREKPFITNFIIHEINRNPGCLVGQMQNSKLDPSRLMKILADEKNNARIRPVDPYHFIVNMVSLCVFPFLAKPIIQGFLLDGTNISFDEFIEQRPEQIISFVKNALFIKNTD